MSNRTLTDEQRRDIVRYRMESALKMLSELRVIGRTAFTTRLSTACTTPATMPPRPSS